MSSQDYKSKLKALKVIADDKSDDRLSITEFNEIYEDMKKGSTELINSTLALMEEKEAKEAKIRAKSSEFYNEVIDKLMNKGVNNLRVVRPTGFGKSYLLSKLSYSAEELTGMERSSEYKNMSLYIYPTDIIKDQMIRDYGPDGERAENRLRGVIFVSYSRIGKIINTFEEGKPYKFCINRIDKFYKRAEDGIYEMDGGKAKKNTQWGPVEVKNIYELRQWLSEFIGILLIDECHKVGADSFRKFWYAVNYMDIAGTKKDKLVLEKDDYNFVEGYNRIPNGVFVNRAGKTGRKVIGVTATEFRQDGQDPNTIIGNAISKYNLADAIRDGHLQKVDYIYTIGDKDLFRESIVNAINSFRERSEKFNKVTWNEEIELNKIIENNFKPLGLTIRENITDKHRPKDNLGRRMDYVKLIVFFNNTIDLKSRHDWIIGEFKSAFPDKNVNEYIIVSEKNEAGIMSAGSNINSNDTSKGLRATSPNIMNKYTKPANGVVDIILCVDVLNMGYHVDDITGVVIIRNTQSAIIYNQQIGRCFSVKSTTTPIVIDVIDVNAGDRLLSSSNAASGYKIDLPELLGNGKEEDECQIIDTSKDINNLISKFSFNEYEMVDSILFMYKNRGASVEVLKDMFNISEDKIISILKDFGEVIENG